MFRRFVKNSNNIKIKIFAEFRTIYYKYIKPYCESSEYGDGSHPKFGVAVISPVVLSTVFVLFHWYNTESGLKNKLMTLPFVLCQVWPQYRILRILYFGLIKKSYQWKVENEEHKKDVSSLGMECFKQTSCDLVDLYFC